MNKYLKLFRNRYVKISVIAVIFIFLYSIAGFFVLPKIIKPRLESILSEVTGEKVSIKQLHTNPYSLSVNVKNLKISDDQKQTKIANFEGLYINFNISSLYRESFIFSDVQILSPYLHLKMLKDGTLNISKLIPSSDKAENNNESSVSFFVDSFVVRNGSLVYEELNRPKPYVEKISSINIDAKQLDTKNTGGSYNLDARLASGGRILWNGRVSFSPPGSEGRFRLENINLETVLRYFRNKTDFEANSGSISSSGDYGFYTKQEGTDFNVKNSSIELKDVILGNTDSQGDIVKIPDIQANGFSLSTADKNVELSSLISKNGSVKAIIDSEGNFNLDNFYKPSEETKQTENEPSDWNVRINKVNAQGYTLDFTDLSKGETVNLKATNIGIDINDIVLGEKSESGFSVNAVVNDQAKLDLSGNTNFETLNTDFVFNLKGIGSLPLYPYLRDFVDLKIEEGNIKVDGMIKQQEGGKKKRLVYSGNATLSSFTVRGYPRDEVFTSFSKLELNKIFLDIGEFERISIEQILLTEPFLQLIIFPDNRTNIHSIFLDSQKDGDRKNGKSDKKEDEKKGTHYTINSIKIKDGVMDFSDLSLQPNFRVNIKDLHGTISKISSEIESNTKIDIEGSVGKYSPVTINGYINLAKEDILADINMDFNNLHLATFNPYSVQFAGYKIDRGTMDLDLQYTLKENIVRGENHIVIKQIKLGEKVVKPDQNSLPLDLAIALLKDSSGVIDINLPVSGNIENPEFSFGSIIANAFSGLISKIVKSPFSLLGKLVGLGGEELSYVRFSYGTKQLSQEQKNKLDKLSVAMSKRPEVILEARGIAVTPDDKNALAQKIVFSRIFENSSDTNAEDMGMKEYRMVLEYYEEQYDQDPLETIRKTDRQGNKIPEPTRIVMAARESFKELISNTEIQEEQLSQLASSRAENVRNYLINKQGIHNERIVILSPEIIQNDNAEVVKIPLYIRTY